MKSPQFFKNSSESGQALLISLGVLLLLFVSIPVIIFTGTSGVTHQIQSQRQAEGREFAEQGIAYASQSFAAQQGAWNIGVGLGGNFTTLFAAVSGCPGAPALPARTPFALNCVDRRTIAQLQPYQVLVTATAMVGPDLDHLKPGASIQTILSQKTLAASLSNGLRASAALSVIQAPTGFTALPHLMVQWGPIVYIDWNAAAAPWQLTDSLDSVLVGGISYPGFPRKFATTDITGTQFPRSVTAFSNFSKNSDEREYWAHASIAPMPAIDESSYIIRAATEIPPTGGFPHVQCVFGSGACPTTLNSDLLWGDGTGVFDAGAGQIQFPANYPVPANSVIYVHGDALINAGLDMGVGGAFIATGRITVDAIGGGQIPSTSTINIPITAPEEYPYIPAAAPAASQMVCYNNYQSAWVNSTPPILPTCQESDIQVAIGSDVNFRGFLWAKGGLIVSRDATLPFTIVGAVQVGDRITNTTATITGQTTSSTLNIFFDAGTNQSILTVAN